MGIRFYCPNGHKLNVKAEQAGKTALCPKCGVKLQIPLESTREPHHSSASSMELRGGDAVPADDGDILLTSKPQEFADFDNPQPPAPQPPAAPLPEKERAWYIQGGDDKKYGPVDSRTIQIWISEHRVAAATMVWQEGWSEWKTARDVFPEFRGAELPPMIHEQTSEPPKDDVSELREAVRGGQKTERSSEAKLLKKKQKAFREMMTVIVLAVVILILAAVLAVLVLRNGGNDDQETVSEPPAASLVLTGGQTIV